MVQKALEIRYEVFAHYSELPEEDANLLLKAYEATSLAYAPYSDFKVGAAAYLLNGELLLGSNQENASFPAGICAERVLLAAASSIHPGVAIKTLAVGYVFQDKPGDHPVAPCGVCRQVLREFEDRMHQPMRLILGGKEGEVFVFESVGSLLPLHFSSKELS